MSTIRRVAKNTVVLYASYLVSTVSSLLLSIAIARELGDVIFGKYAFAAAFTTLFSILLDAGLNLVIVRDVARDKSLAPKYMGSIIIIKIVLSVVTFGLIALVITLAHRPHDTTIAVLFFGINFILTGFGDIFRTVFRAFEKMEYEAVISTVSRLTAVFWGLAAIFLGYGLIAIALGFVIGGIFDIALGLFACVKKFAKPKIEVDLDFIKKLAKISLPIAVLDIITIIYVRTDIVMLEAMKGDAVVGRYNAAYNLVQSIQFIPSILLTGLLPAMSVFYVSSPDLLRVSCERALRYLMILGLPIAVGTSLLADRFILIFYGDQFTGSVIALQILAWYVVFSYVYMPLAYVLTSMNKQNIMALIAGVCVIVNATLNAILIPSLSYKGAGIATIVTVAFLSVSYFRLVSRYLYRPSLHRMVVKPLAACAIMAAFVYFCSDISLSALILIAAVLYFAALYLLRGFAKEDFYLLRQVLPYLRQRQAK